MPSTAAERTRASMAGTVAAARGCGVAKTPRGAPNQRGAVLGRGPTPGPGHAYVGVPNPDGGVELVPLRLSARWFLRVVALPAAACSSRQGGQAPKVPVSVARVEHRAV